MGKHRIQPEPISETALAVDNSKKRGTHMKSKPLGSSGIHVSNFALGTMTFGAETSKADAFRQLDEFTDRGGTYIDTADGYADGASEQIIGEWSAQRGGVTDLVIATKGRFSPPPGSAGASRRSLVRSIDASLKRLKADAIDLYYVHGWDPNTDVQDTLLALKDLVAAGKIHHFAWSNTAGWQLQKILTLSDKLGVSRPACLQVQYNLLERGIELEVLPCCLENSVAITVWSPLAGGWLTGKYSAVERPATDTRLGDDPKRGDGYDFRNSDRTYAILALMKQIAEGRDCPLAHVALAWAASRPGVASVLVGARTVQQMQSNLAASELNLTENEAAALCRASGAGTLPYPYNFLGGPCGMKVWHTLGT
ncbi:aryl-alcohol dehydrogenase-like predicted oxidoreductase [Labrenzia sp. EL_126]|nr:aryl-alcohol dehydrogenase-like predicted oxidoreductase [Labrenzia sp. EL_126]